MRLLPEDFLNQLASDYELSPEQKEVFVQRFSSKGNELDAAEFLYISPEASRTRMTWVYKKFSIGGKGPNKARRLHDWLIREYEKAHSSTIDETLNTDKDIDSLVQEIRKKVKSSIQERCGKMRVLDMEQPVGLGDIYTDVNILEKVTGRRRLGIAELLQICEPENFDRFGLSKVEKRVPGLKAVEQHQKLMVLGKPGAGKTTFLKYLAIQCIVGKFQAQRVPIFITLKQFAENKEQPELGGFIIQQLAKDKVAESQISELLNSGRALVLLDGLDEVGEEDISRVLKQLKEFSEHYHQNPFVITCRIAAREYTFEQFAEVEVADFDDQQIADFSNKWFQIKDLKKAKKFIQKLQKDKPIRELGTNPLLLTLLCLVFEESADFPSNRSQLYKEGLDILLKKWDAKRNIEREQVYKKLSLQRKEDLLSQIALTTFEEGNYFFKQQEVEKHIVNYIRNIPNASTDLEELQLDSEAVLKSIEAQHGLLVERAKSIYSFSHLTFQEYFTAKEIVESPASKALEKLEILSSNITEKRWREVFLLAIGMLPNAGDLLELMKKKTDALVASDEKIQQFLSWLNQKSLSVKAAYKPAAVRAFYIVRALNRNLDRNLDLNLARDLDRVLARDFARDLDRVLAHAFNLALDRVLDRNLALDLALDDALDEALDSALNRVLDHNSTLDFAINSALDSALNSTLDLDHALKVELQHSLQELKAQLPNLNNSKESNRRYTLWWRVNSQNWIKRLNTVMIEQRNIGHDWQFSQPHLELFSQYFYANRLLVDCLNSDCYVSREVRQEIENSLLLPMAEIENLSSNQFVGS
ncbi:NACHT domain-containing NTPase [Trichocoleus sp. DQ-U1]|uniref:NACHT domain-containing protein n=1 Tax=Trichocoleus sp. DQ-U1 TaxID=2933926 RepID=UPI0032990490